MTETPQELMAQLDSASARLPNRTLFQLSLAGLRVRLMRSLVTLLSVVLAIAYLSYSGVSNSLVYKVASSGSEEMYTLLRAAKINVEATRAGNPLDKWLVIMALLTCTVGIANAMLMAVTERFREIGTMKCLGAEDSTVIKLFLIESSLLGVVGSAIGVILGTAISVIVGMSLFCRGAGTFMAYALLAALGLAALGAVVGVVVRAMWRPPLGPELVAEGQSASGGPESFGRAAGLSLGILLGVIGLAVELAQFSVRYPPYVAMLVLMAAMTAAVAAAVGALVGRIAARVEGAPKHHAAIAAIAGFALALIMSLVAGPYSFRNFILAYMPFGAILTYGGLSFAAGIFLCLIGAGYPARVAAKMRPVEALRVEE